MLEHPDHVMAIREGCLQFCEDEGIAPNEEVFAEVVVGVLLDAARDARSVVDAHFPEQELEPLLEEEGATRSSASRRCPAAAAPKKLDR
jgi:hypothetical protein